MFIIFFQTAEIVFARVSQRIIHSAVDSDFCSNIFYYYKTIPKINHGNNIIIDGSVTIS